MSELAGLLANGVVVLDGAMSTELTKLGVDTSSSLWGAVALDKSPEAIKQVYASYLAAGAQVVSTNTYQATVPGFVDVGYSSERAIELIRRGAELAFEAVTEWQTQHPDAKIVVTGSIGPYGAYLADGSEYTGDYQLSAEQYRDFHRPRIAALVEAGVDIFAVETQPRLDEVQAIIGLLASEFPHCLALTSFQMANEACLPDGSAITQAVSWASAQPNVAAVGFNCVQPAIVTPALAALAADGAAGKPLMCYPNSGDQYVATTKTWITAHDHQRFTAEVADWLNLGVRLIGGCCRTTPDDIAEVARLVAAAQA